MIDLHDAGKAKFDWWLDWRDECVAIVASGPSTTNANLKKLKNRIHVVAINECYQLCPWADVLYSCDAEWWHLREEKIKKFAGMKMTFDHPRQPCRVANVCKFKIPELNNTWVNDFLFDKPGVIGSGGNSGFQTINISAQFGVSAIMLIGFDMDGSNLIHWHGQHPVPLRNPDAFRLREWRKMLDDNAAKLEAAGIDVVNCSKISTLKAFKKLTMDEALERWGL